MVISALAFVVLMSVPKVPETAVHDEIGTETITVNSDAVINAAAP